MSDISRIRQFVDDRLAESAVPNGVANSCHATLIIIDSLPAKAASDDAWSWLTGAGTALIDTVFGYDANSSAERLASALLAALALIWADHRDFGPAWRALLDGQ